MTYPQPDRLRVSQIVKACCLNDVEFINYMLMGQRQTDAMLRGTVLHGLVLEGKAPDNIAPLPYEDFRKKEAQESKAEALGRGMVPVKKSDLETWKRVVDPALVKEFAGYEIEKPLFGQLDGYGAIQGKLDAVRMGERVKDLKTTESAFFKRLHSNIFEYGYDLQLYLYMLLAGAEWASIVLLDCISGCWKRVEFSRTDIEYFCQVRLLRGVQNIQIWQEYSAGKKQVESEAYEPPAWVNGELAVIENMNEGIENDTTDGTGQQAA